MPSRDARFLRLSLASSSWAMILVHFEDSDRGRSEVGISSTSRKLYGPSYCFSKRFLGTDDSRCDFGAATRGLVAGSGFASARNPVISLNSIR
jgi:hypothetical protein